MQIDQRRELENMCGVSNLNSQYMLDLEFQNIKQITYSVSDEGLPQGEVFVTILI